MEVHQQIVVKVYLAVSQHESFMLEELLENPIYPPKAVINLCHHVYNLGVQAGRAEDGEEEQATPPVFDPWAIMRDYDRELHKDFRINMKVGLSSTGQSDVVDGYEDNPDEMRRRDI
jgi:hypothetical protein